ncbi:nitrate transporter, partial [Trifolium medium]|nr:nitrate transporter [Trifolium medium]
AGESCKPANGFQMGILYLALYLIALGTGGLKSSVSGFGSDQFDEKDEKEQSQRTYFFNRFFFFISLGTLAAVTVLVYIQDEELKDTDTRRVWEALLSTFSKLLLHQ